MYVLAIDPGDSTGLVLLSDTLVVWAVTCKHPFDEVRSAVATYHDSLIVCEDVPSVHRHRGDAFEEVKKILDDSNADVTYLSPSQWKGHPTSRLREMDQVKLITKHEKEATGLGRRFLAMRRADAKGKSRTVNQPAGGHAAVT